MRGEDRPEPPQRADEAETLLGFLDYQRATFEWRISGLDEEQLQVRVAASSMTLGGLTKHLAFVEDNWATEWVEGQPRREPWASADFDADWDWDFNSAVEHTPDEVRLFWQSRVEAARSTMTAAINERGLGGLAIKQWPDGQSPSLRWILVHLIEEYARHNGHADLIREAIDGQTGE